MMSQPLSASSRVGKVSFAAPDLLRNASAVLDELQRVKPAAAKGRYLKKVSVSSTMGPGVKIDPTKIAEEASIGS
jgi:large subunit ribosomal protein L1